MGKIIAEVALIAGAVVLDVMSDGLATGFLSAMTATQISSMALSIGVMGGGMLMSSISQAIAGGGVSTSQSVRGSAQNRRTIYGQTRTNGAKIYESNHSYAAWGFNQVVVWASHPCQSVDYIYLDGREVYFTGNNHQAVAGASGYCDENSHYTPSNSIYDFRDGSNYHVYAENTLGNGAYLTGLGVGVPPPSGDFVFFGDPGWTSTCLLNGCTATYVGAASSATMFAGVFPQVKALVRGKNNIYDPRCAVTVGSTVILNNVSYTVTAATLPSGINTSGSFTISGTGPVTGSVTTTGYISATPQIPIYNLSGNGSRYSYTNYGWTDNAALIIADFLVNPDYGFAMSWAKINTIQLAAAANLCDELIPLATAVGTWLPNHVFTPGQIIVDSNGRQQQCIGYETNGSSGIYSGGTSGSSQPGWMTGPGQASRDNQIEWLSLTTMGTTVSEKMYTINGEFEWSATPGDTLSQMLESIGGKRCINYWNGQWNIMPATWYGTSGVSYGLGDIIDKVSFKRTKYRDLCNAVRAKYISPTYPYSVAGYDKAHQDTQVFDGMYQPTDAPAYMQDYLHGYGTISSQDQGDQWLLQDNGVRLYQDQSYKFVQSCATAQRLMKIYLLRNRFQWTGTIRVNSKGLQNVPGDVIQLTIPEYGFSNHLFEIQEVRHIFQIEDGKPPQLAWEFDLKETDPSIYTWSTAEEMTYLNASSPTLADGLAAPVPLTGLSITAALADAVVGADGIISPRLNVQWIESTDPFVTGNGKVIVQYQPFGASSWLTAGIIPGTSSQIYIPGAVANQSYTVQVACAHASGGTSAWTSSSITVGNNVSNNIGGSNILNNSGFESGGLLGWGLYNNASSSFIALTADTSTCLTGTTSAKVAWTQATVSTCGVFATGSPAWNDVGGWVPNTTYILSFYCQATGSAVGTFPYIAFNTNPTTTAYLQNPPLSTSWQRYVVSLTWGAAVDNGFFITMAVPQSAAGTCHFDCIQITEGNVTTDYAPSPFETSANAVTAVNAAAAAQSTATAAENTLAIIGSSNWLSMSQKPQVLQLWNTIHGEYPGVCSTAACFGVSSTTYTTAYAALGAYLQATYPAGVGAGGNDWFNTATNSQIVDSTWEAAWTAYYNAKQAILNTIATASEVAMVNNANFEQGATGWNCQGGWVIEQAGQSYGGGSWSAVCNAGSGSSAILNTAQTPCLPGQVFSATCMAFGSPWPAYTGLDGTLCARVVFVNSAGAVVAYTDGFHLTSANTSWAQSKSTFTAPAGAVAVYMDIACYNHSVGTWFVDACQLSYDGDGTSTSLNNQGSIIPTQAIAYTTGFTNTSASVSVSAQSLLRADGSTLTVNASTVSYTGLIPSTTYYIYPYISTATGNVMAANGTPPPTTSSIILGLETAFDGCVPVIAGGGSVSITTLASPGSGGGTHYPPCPESAELVQEQTKGQITAGSVVVGDCLLGHDFTTNADVYRKVQQVGFSTCYAWRMVDGHKNSPCESVYYNGQWTPAFRVPGATVNNDKGVKAEITVTASADNDHNYYLVSGNKLLIHNMLMGC